MKQEKSCGAIVYTQKDNTFYYLLIQHKNGAHWAYPKGHVEQDETEEQTALREIQEETGLDVILDTEFREAVSYSPKSDVLKEVIYFIAEAKSVDIIRQEIEVTSFEWLPFEEAFAQLTYENDTRILSKANNYLLNNSN